MAQSSKSAAQLKTSTQVTCVHGRIGTGRRLDAGFGAGYRYLCAGSLSPEGAG